MTDWSLPTTASTYANYTTELINRDVSLAKQFDSALVTDTNVVTDTIRWNSTSKIWERWSGTAWGALAATYGINVSQLLGSTWAAPGTIGSTTPSTGAFTTLTAGATSVTALTASSSFQSTGDTAPASGTGVEIRHSGTLGKIVSYNRTGAAYTALNINSSQTDLDISGVNIARLTSTGIVVTGTLTASSDLTLTNGVLTSPTHVYLKSAATGHILLQPNGGGTVLDVLSTGVAVTGTGSFTGILTAPTAAAGTDTTQVATTAFVKAESRLTLDTQQATTSGTTKDFTIPAGTKRVTIMFDGVSFNATDDLLVQIGDSGGVETTGYISSTGMGVEASTGGGASSTIGFVSGRYYAGAADVMVGSMVLTLINAATFKWIASGTLGYSGNSAASAMGGSKALTAALTTVRITSVAGSTFDLGAVNVISEI